MVGGLTRARQTFRRERAGLLSSLLIVVLDTRYILCQIRSIVCLGSSRCLEINLRLLMHSPMAAARRIMCVIVFNHI